MAQMQPIPQESPPSSKRADERQEFDYSNLSTQKVLDGLGIDKENVDMSQHEVDLSQSFDQKIKSKTKKLVIPVYIAIAIGAVAMIIFALVGDTISTIISLFAIFAMTWLGAIVGMLCTYAWGTVAECIDYFKKQNEKFQGHVDDLKETRVELRDVTKGLFFEVGKLNREGKALESYMHQFDELRKELANVCESNQDLNDLLDDANNQFDALVTVIANNERASLLSMYYETSTKDKEEGLSKREYERFLGRLNDSTKKHFIDAGTFKELAGDDDVIDLKEFEQLLDKVIAEQVDEQLDKQISNV